MKLHRGFRIGGFVRRGPAVGCGLRVALTAALAWSGIVAGVPRAVASRAAFERYRSTPLPDLLIRPFCRRYVGSRAGQL